MKILNEKVISWPIPPAGIHPIVLESLDREQLQRRNEKNGRNDEFAVPPSGAKESGRLLKHRDCVPRLWFHAVPLIPNPDC